MKMLLRVGVLIISLFFGVAAFADMHCTGSIMALGVNRSGLMYVNGPGGLPSVYICNLFSEENGVKPDACKAMYAELLTAYSAGAAVHVTFLPAPSYGCSEFSSWSYAPNINWILRQN